MYYVVMVSNAFDTDSWKTYRLYSDEKDAEKRYRSLVESGRFDRVRLVKILRDYMIA